MTDDWRYSDQRMKVRETVLSILNKGSVDNWTKMDALSIHPKKFTSVSMTGYPKGM